MSDSIFAALGLKPVLEALEKEIRDLYQSDRSPWIIGYSGGKDSTAVLQLVWSALVKLPKDRLIKPIHVISTDTLVENPVVSQWVLRSHASMDAAAKTQGLPFQTHRLTPATEDSFWVNLIGKGYPSPRPKFRWCTERLKIRPSNRLIQDMVRTHGEAILLLGTRKAESAARARTMAKHEAKRIREKLSPNAALPGCLVYSPIEEWSNDDVWCYLTQTDNPWGWSNHDLLGMYAGATEGGECPLVVDTSTPSCGDSRFGCWVCTLVDKDKSMAAMIQNDADKDWMRPLVEFRNDLLDPRDDEGFRNDTSYRDFRRITGMLTLEQVPKLRAEGVPENRSRASAAARERHEYFDRIGRVHHHQEGCTSYLIHGPYIQAYREKMLQRLLEAQRWIAERTPDRASELITLEELEEIRRIWVVDKGECEDALPGIYEAVMGVEYPGPPIDEHRPFGAEEMSVLRECCAYDPGADQGSATQQAARLQYEAARSLIAVVHDFRTKARRRGLFEEIEKSLDRHAFRDEAHALAVAMEHQRARLSGAQAVAAVAGQVAQPQFDDCDIPADAELIDDQITGTGPAESAS